MSVRTGFSLLAALSALLFLAACGGNGNHVAQGTAPPTGSFSNSNLNGTYVFSVSGTDANGDAYAMVGTFTANGSGGNGKGQITGGTVDMTDGGFSAPAPNLAVSNNSSYSVGEDGRGLATLAISNNPFGQNVVLDFVLQDSNHGLVTEADSNATGSGTLDLQSAGTTPNGSYAFSFSGAGPSGAFATVGDFTVGSGGAITAGLQDFNSGGIASTDLALGGAIVQGPSSTPSTTLTTNSGFATLTFDVFAIDASHLKFIEMDTTGTLEGDAFSQTSTNMPTGTLAFTMEGFLAGGAPFAAGGYMVTDNGNIVSPSSEDLNEAGSTVSTAAVPFTGTYAAGTSDPANSGRFLLQNLSGFTGASEFVAYPSSGGTFLLEVDSSLGILSGTAYPPQTSTSFASSEGYGLNLTGANIAAGQQIGASEVEVDDIAEFTAASGGTLSGVIDENALPEYGPTFGIALSAGTYTAIDSNGRYGITATAASGNSATLNGGFSLTAYSVDGTTFPFIQSDANGQVSAGVFVQQNPSASSSAVAKSHSMFVPHPMARPSARKRK